MLINSFTFSVIGCGWKFFISSGHGEQYSKRRAEQIQSKRMLAREFLWKNLRPIVESGNKFMMFPAINDRKYSRLKRNYKFPAFNFRQLVTFNCYFWQLMHFKLLKNDSGTALLHPCKPFSKSVGKHNWNPRLKILTGVCFISPAYWLLATGRHPLLISDRECERVLKGGIHMDWMAYLKVRDIRLPAKASGLDSWKIRAWQCSTSLVLEGFDTILTYTQLTTMLNLAFRDIWQPLPPAFLI